MITHYTLQSKDHKIAVREEDILLSEYKIVRQALKHYYTSLEKSFERNRDEGLDDVARLIKTELDGVLQLRRKLDGRDW